MRRGSAVARPVMTPAAPSASEFIWCPQDPATPPQIQFEISLSIGVTPAQVSLLAPGHPAPLALLAPASVPLAPASALPCPRSIILLPLVIRHSPCPPRSAPDPPCSNTLLAPAPPAQPAPIRTPRTTACPKPGSIRKAVSHGALIQAVTARIEIAPIHALDSRTLV
jgi:hypothetical protein